MILLLLFLAQNVLPTVPGAINPHVTQANIHQTICVKGYTKTARNVPNAVKAVVYLRGQVVNKRSVEVDHLISLELGGSNDIANLWAEPYDPRPGAHEKDRVENFLHRQVCSGSMTLAAAQRAIATDWTKVYRSIK